MVAHSCKNAGAELGSCIRELARCSVTTDPTRQLEVFTIREDTFIRMGPVGEPEQPGRDHRAVVGDRGEQVGSGVR